MNNKYISLEIVENGFIVSATPNDFSQEKRQIATTVDGALEIAKSMLEKLGGPKPATEEK